MYNKYSSTESQFFLTPSPGPAAPGVPVTLPLDLQDDDFEPRLERYVRIAHLPQGQRHIKLFGQIPLILTKGTADAFADAGTVQRSKYFSNVLPVNNASIRETICKAFPGINLKRTIFGFTKLYNAHAKQLFEISNSKFREHRENYFDNCYVPLKDGFVYVDPQNKGPGGESIVKNTQRFSCSEPGCLFCSTRARQRLASEKLADMRSIISANEQGFDAAHHMVMTLPQGLEAFPFEDKDLAKSLKNAAQDTIRKCFGASARSNIPIYVAVHPVGDNDVMKNRWHVHCLVLPGEVYKDKKTGEKKFHWLKPADSDSRFMINVDLFKASWADHLKKIFGYEGPCNVHTQFIKYEADKTDAFYSRLMHTIKYNYRSFATDLEDAVVGYENLTGMVFIKQKIGKRVQIYVCHISDYVKRFKWIKENNEVRARGLATSLQKNAEVLGIELDDEKTEDEDMLEVEARVEIIRDRVFDHVKKRYVTVKDEIYHFTDPFTGQPRAVRKSDLDKRLKSKWRPKCQVEMEKE